MLRQILTNPRLVRVMPVVLGAECLLASLAYLSTKDWRNTAYWFFAACINLSLGIL